jgi:hypothetical protein
VNGHHLRPLGIADEHPAGREQVVLFHADMSGQVVQVEAGIPRSRPVSRPMSPRIAWAFISMLASEPVPDVSDRELARLEATYRPLLASPSPALLLRSWLRSRAQPAPNTLALVPSKAGSKGTRSR